jgi:hypothetical protein
MTKRADNTKQYEFRRLISQRDAEIARLLTALREAKEDIENSDEAGAYLIIKQRSTALTRQKLRQPVRTNFEQPVL